MGDSEHLHQQERSTSEGPEAQEGTRSMPPPAFNLSAGGEDPNASGGPNRGANGAVAQRQIASPVIQRVDDYTQFPDAVRAVLLPYDQEIAPGSPAHPSTYNDVLPSNCRLVLWDLFKASHWDESHGRSARQWAETALQGMRDLMVELGSNGVPGPPLLREVRNSLAPIVNPGSGSAGGNSMEEVLVSAIDNNRVSQEGTRHYDREARNAEELHAVLVGASHILSPELNAEVPGQILNAATPYNYLYYRGRPGVRTTKFNTLKSLYGARWEARSRAQRRQKINYGNRNMNSLYSGRAQARMLGTLTNLDEAGIAASVAAIQAAITTHIRDRIAAIGSDTEITQIARNGAAIPARARRRTRGGGRGRRATDIEYEEGTVVTPWENTLTAATTSEEARGLLGDEPHVSLDGKNIGSRRGNNYSYNRNGRSYRIVAKATDPPFFGIQYTGGSSLTYAAMDSLLNDSEHNYFTPAQRIIVQAIRPHVASEGSVSSINTYDKQYLTVAGRGEKGNMVTNMIDAAERLMTDYETPVDLSALRPLVDELGARSETGTAGGRLNIRSIEALINLLEQPEIHRAMTLAKISDSILRFYGEPLTRGGGASRYNAHATADSEDRLNAETTHNNLHPAVIGVAIHNSLGSPAEWPNPMEYAIRANRRYPQRAGFNSETTPDFEMLSKQVAFMMKIRMQNKWNRAGHAPVVSQRYLAIFKQKATDFENFFGDTDIERTGSTFFDYSAASSILPFWTGDGNYASTNDTPSEGTLYIRRKTGRTSRVNHLMGPMLDGAVTSLATQVDIATGDEG